MRCSSVLALAATCFAACQTVTPDPNTQVVVTIDPAMPMPPPDDEVGATDDCSRAYRIMYAHRCPDAAPSDGGETFIALCRRERALIDATCIAGKSTAAGLLACHVRGCA